jgi:DEAD/DEAH box helicase domain-containing protein
MDGNHFSYFCIPIRSNERRYHPNPKLLPYPSKHVSIRGIKDETYCAIDVTKLGQPEGQARILEEVEVGRALFELYEGAIVRVFFLIYLDVD